MIRRSGREKNGSRRIPVNHGKNRKYHNARFDAFCVGWPISYLVSLDRILNHAVVARRDDDELFAGAGDELVILADEDLRALLEARDVGVLVQHMDVLIWS